MLFRLENVKKDYYYEVTRDSDLVQPKLCPKKCVNL
jgi:hypothetical protein